MTKDLLIHFRTRIESELENLEQRTSSVRRELLKRAEVRPTVISNGLDHAKEESDLNTRLDLNERDIKLVTRLHIALNKIAIGTYGECDGCEEPIAMQRLHAQPTATLCLKCQSRFEQIDKYTPTREIPQNMLRDWFAGIGGIAC